MPLVLSFRGFCFLKVHTSYSEQWWAEYQVHVKRPISKNDQKNDFLCLKVEMMKCARNKNSNFQHILLNQTDFKI